MSENESDEGGLGGGSSRQPLDWAKKLLTLGVGAVFLTEESIRGTVQEFVQEFKLPKELIVVMLDNAAKIRKDFIQNFSADLMAKISDKIDPQSFITEFFKRNHVTVEMKIKVEEKKGAEKKREETLV